MTQQQAPIHVATEGDREIVTERVFDAPRNDVERITLPPSASPLPAARNT